MRVSPYFGKETNVWIDIERGVKQGCPLSPLLFIIAYDPLLSSLSRIHDINYFAFADDLAITTQNIPSIYPALNNISSFSCVSGLGINKSKSCVLTTTHPASHHLVRSGLEQSPWPDLNLQERGTHLGIRIGRDITLDEIWSEPVGKALNRIKSARNAVKALSLSNRILYVNIFIISLFSYVGLFYVLPAETWLTIKGAISKLVTPFNGGAYTYESLICAKAIFAMKPALKDVWAFNISLLAVRSPLIESKLNYNDLPTIDLTFTKIIMRHRDAAAVDFWRSRHLPDGTLVPIPALTSAAVYNIVILDVYHDKAARHCAAKLHKAAAPSSPALPSPDALISSITSNLTSTRLPPFLITHHLTLLNPALPTSRRLRHQNKVGIDAVPSCFFCGVGQDSYTHIFTECVSIAHARDHLFHTLTLPPPH